MYTTLKTLKKKMLYPTSIFRRLSHFHIFLMSTNLFFCSFLLLTPLSFSFINFYFLNLDLHRYIYMRWTLAHAHNGKNTIYTIHYMRCGPRKVASYFYVVFLLLFLLCVECRMSSIHAKSPAFLSARTPVCICYVFLVIQITYDDK